MRPRRGRIVLRRLKITENAPAAVLSQKDGRNRGRLWSDRFRDERCVVDCSDVFVRETYSVEPRIDAFVEKQLRARLALRVEGGASASRASGATGPWFADSAVEGAVLRLESFEEVRGRRLIVKLRGSF